MLRLLFVFGLLLPSLLVFAPISATPAQAAENLKVTVRPGLDGMIKLGTWFPVEIQVANTGPDIIGDVQVQIDGIENRGAFSRPPIIYNAPTQLPRLSNKRIVVEAFLPNAADKITAKVISNGTVVGQAEATFERVGQNELLCGVLSGNRNALDFLAGIDLTGRTQRRVRLANLDVVDLPSSPQLFSSLDCLIVSNVSLTNVTDQQRAALGSWTAAGGLLVVAGGPGWQKTVVGLPPGLLPVEVTGTVPLRSAPGLEAYGGDKIEDPGPWLVARSKVTDGAVVVSEEGLPLVVAARRGQGVVIFLALDPSLEPLRSWRGSAQFWRHIVDILPSQVQVPSNFIKQYVGWGRVPRVAMGDLSTLRPVSGDLIPGILLIFALVVGPAAYLGLRRIGRLEWILWVAPVVAGLAALGTFAVARGGGESDILFNKISLVRAWDTRADAYSRTYVTAFSPRDGSYEVATSGRNGHSDQLIFPIYFPFPMASGTPTPGANPITVQRGGSTSLKDFELSARSLGSFQVDSRVPLSPGFKTDLALNGTTITGTISTGGERITNAALIVGGDVLRLGDMAAGEQRQIVAQMSAGSAIGFVDLPGVVRQLYPNPVNATPVSTNEAMSRDILDAAFNANFNLSSSRLDLSPVTFVGWMDKAPVDFQTRNARASELDRTLLVASLGVDIPSSEQIRIPSALIERRNVLSGIGRISQGSITLSNGESLFLEYMLPARPDQFKLADLALETSITGVTPATPPLADVSQLSVYDWVSTTWRDVGLTPNATILGDPSRVVSSIGQVRIRLTFKPPIGGQSSSQLNFDRLDLAVHGRST